PHFLWRKEFSFGLSAERSKLEIKPCTGAPLQRKQGEFPGSLPTPPARLPYVPHVPPMALLGKVTATTFALERPRCVFDGHADASDAVWLAVAFANGEHSLLRHVPPLPTARSYMTLETAAAAYSCSAQSPPVLRVGGDTACREQGRQDPCNGPLPSPGPYRVKFLALEGSVPVAETDWSAPITLRTGTGAHPAPTPSPQGENGVVLGVWGGPRGLNAEQQWFGVRAPVSSWRN
uniref:Uroplakin 3B n=1 Tax=Serinus canaria TaxID=9135 RepID=A0A8C9UAU3_SERCA